MMKKHKTAGKMNLAGVENISPDDLYLDFKNPRLTGRDFAIDDQEEILRYLWQDKEISELVYSIANNGYWPQEVMFATKEAGRYIVVEGNRRLAAVKLLRSPALCAKIDAKGIPVGLPLPIRKTFDLLPVIVCDRIELWTYMGFKHLNGPQEWDSIAKAEYIAHVHEDFKIPLASIANAIGDEHQTVKRLYLGLTVVRQAESSGVFNREKIWGARFPFSHLWTGLGYSSVQKFLGLKKESKDTPTPVPEHHISQLGEFCTWLFGYRDSKVKRKPIVKSQNPDLRKLSEILSSEKGIAALRKIKEGEGLDDIWRFTRGDEVMLLEALVEAEKSLREAYGYLPTGFVLGRSLIIKQGESIFQLASAIHEFMRQPAPEITKKK